MKFFTKCNRNRSNHHHFLESKLALLCKQLIRHEIEQQKLNYCRISGFDYFSTAGFVNWSLSKMEEKTTLYCVETSPTNKWDLVKSYRARRVFLLKIWKLPELGDPRDTWGQISLRILSLFEFSQMTKSKWLEASFLVFGAEIDLKL